MTIYNGPSIYNQGGGGGGGGGYHDGGQIVDADFMKVENNAVSSYDNTSRDPINFYFEPADGEILNAIVELTTAVNSTVNVYVLRNGFYYLLGNVGGDTVTAGNDYKVNITGDSYAIEQVSGGLTPEYISLNGNLYGIMQVGSLLWLNSNLKEQSYNYAYDGTTYYYSHESIKNINIDGWRLPYRDEFTTLKNSYNYQDLKSSTEWKDGKNGTNASGFNAYPKGMYKANYSEYSNVTEYAQFQGNVSSSDQSPVSFLIGYNDSSWTVGTGVLDFWEPVRLVKPV